MYHFNNPRRTVFILLKKKKKGKRDPGLIDSDPVASLTSCQEQLSGKYIYLETEKNNPS